MQSRRPQDPTLQQDRPSSLISSSISFFTVTSKSLPQRVMPLSSPSRSKSDSFRSTSSSSSSSRSLFHISPSYPVFSSHPSAPLKLHLPPFCRALPRYSSLPPPAYHPRPALTITVSRTTFDTLSSATSCDSFEDALNRYIDGRGDEDATHAGSLPQETRRQERARGRVWQRKAYATERFQRRWSRRLRARGSAEDGE